MSELRELGAAVGSSIPADMPMHGELMTADRSSVRGALRDVRPDLATNAAEGGIDALTTAAPAVLDFVAEHTAVEAFAALGLVAEGGHVVAAGWLYAHTLGAGDANELLYAALGGPRDSVENRGMAAGVGVVLLGLSDADVADVRAGLPARALGAFDRGVARAEELEGTLGFEEAEETYRTLQRDWADGRAAALGGWDDPSRGGAFAAARARTAAWMESSPEAAAGERAEYGAAFREGFLAADGTVDAYRERTDAAYRAGARWHGESAAGGTPDAERARLGGTTASVLTLGLPVRA